VVICLERGADLHVAQLMPLPLTVFCFSKIQVGYSVLVPADRGSPGKGPLNVCPLSVSRLLFLHFRNRMETALKEVILCFFFDFHTVFLSIFFSDTVQLMLLVGW